MKIKSEDIDNLLLQERKLSNEIIDFIKKEKNDIYNEVLYLPNIIPTEKVHYIFIAMEPSFGKWKSVEEAQNQINNGFRNFISSKEDFLLHYSISNYLSKSYHITDISKVASKVNNIDEIRTKIYEKCTNQLYDEIKLFGFNNTKIICLGKKSFEEISNCKFFTNYQKHEILHFSKRAILHRNRIPNKNPEEFNEFINNFSSLNFKNFIIEILNKNIDNIYIKNTILKKLKLNVEDSDINVNEYDYKLLFTYKISFEQILNV